MTVAFTYYTLAKRFVSFCGISSIALLCDICFAWFLHTALHLPYTYAIGISFLTSLTLCYFPLRKYTFKGTKREFFSGYLYFIIIACFGLCITVGGTALIVGLFGIHPLIVRFCISGINGFFNFLLNTFYNFKVA